MNRPRRGWMRVWISVHSTAQYEEKIQKAQLFTGVLSHLMVLLVSKAKGVYCS